MGAGDAPTEDLLPVPGAERSEDRQHWHDVATGVAEQLQVDLLDRDRAGGPPYAEVEILRDAGLLALRIPASGGGVGADLATTFDVLRTIARVDGSVAHLLGYHYNFGVGSLADAKPEVADRVWRETVQHGWLWASTGSPQDAALVLERDEFGDGWTLTGRKTFATGSKVADRILGFVRDPETDHDLAVSVDPGRDGIRRRDDWDVLGQRLSASNGIDFDGYRVSRDDVLIDYGPRGQERAPQLTLGVLFSQLLFSELCHAMAEGVLLRARDYLRTSSRPWFHADVDTPRQDPSLLIQLGELVAQLQAVAALNAQAVAGLEHAYAQGGELSVADRAAVAELIATTRVVANRTTLQVASQVFDVMGARAAAQSYGFDLAWRNIRTLTLHDPTAYKSREIGEYVLNGTLPTPSPYR